MSIRSDQYKITLIKKLDDMHRSGVLISAVFVDMDEWDQVDIKRRPLAEIEMDHLRTQARQRIRAHNRRKATL